MFIAGLEHRITGTATHAVPVNSHQINKATAEPQRPNKPARE
jgi:hypothetical protein